MNGDEVRCGDAALVVDAASRRGSLAATWWFPGGEPVGLVWLQHGFSRRPRHVAGLARSLAATTGAAVCTPAASSRFLGRHGLWINGTAMHRSVARLFAGDRQELQRSFRRAASAAGLGELRMPARFVMCGHSAGGNLALAAAGWIAGPDGDERAAADLAGVVMLDGVDRAGAMAEALGRLAGDRWRPVWTVAAPDSPCNAKGKGTGALRGARPEGFVGVLLEGGTHVDAEGEGTGRPAAMVCGRPRPENVAALRVLAADWVTNQLRGSPGDALLAGSPAGERTSVGSAVAVTL